MFASTQDYKKLLVENEQLKSKVKHQQDNNKGLYNRLVKQKRTLAELKAKVRRLEDA